MAHPGRPMSENTVNAALRRMGQSKDEMTGHGFRSTASTHLNEHGWKDNAIERQLAHAERDDVRGLQLRGALAGAAEDDAGVGGLPVQKYAKRDSFRAAIARFHVS